MAVTVSRRDRVGRKGTDGTHSGPWLHTAHGNLHRNAISANQAVENIGTCSEQTIQAIQANQFLFASYYDAEASMSTCNHLVSSLISPRILHNVVVPSIAHRHRFHSALLLLICDCSLVTGRGSVVGGRDFLRRLRGQKWVTTGEKRLGTTE
jgi:hypothetical protein